VTGWPTIDEAAFHGPAGEFVLWTEPHTEADPVALLVQFLVCFGVAAGHITDPGTEQPQQEAPRDRTRPDSFGGGRPATTRDPATRTRTARRSLDPDHAAQAA
jgi:hypothetical protein